MSFLSSFWFFIFLLQNQKTRRPNRPCEVVGTSGRGKEVGKGCGTVSVVYILCTLVCKCKMRSVETIPGRRDKWSRRGGEFKYDVFDTF
jgi:hypothetical protein